MEIWLQKSMTNTSLMNMETLTPKGVPGGISKLVIYGSKELHGHSLLLKQKLGVARTFGNHTLWKDLSSPTELAQHISDQESLVPPHPLCAADHASESFPVLFAKISPCPSNLPSKQKPALLSLLSTTYLHIFIFTPIYLPP